MACAPGGREPCRAVLEILVHRGESGNGEVGRVRQSWTTWSGEPKARDGWRWIPPDGRRRGLGPQEIAGHMQ
jgi:hypothetical protein